MLRPVAHRRMLPAAPPAFLHRFPFFRALTQRCFRPIPRILRAAPRFVPCSAFPFRTALVLPDVRACRFSLHSVIPLVLQRGGSEIPSAPGKTDCLAAGVYFGGIDFELRCFNNVIRGKSADRARAAAVFPIRRLIPPHRLSRSCFRFRRTTASLCRRIPSPVLPLHVPARILYICGRIPEGAALTAHAESSAQTAQSMKKYIHFPLSSLLQKTKKSVTIYLQKNTDINRR